MFKFFWMSCCTFGVAVAVNATIGTFDIFSNISLKRRYSGLKSCPHSEIQWASSMAKKEMLTDVKNLIFSNFVRDSGAT